MKIESQSLSIRWGTAISFSLALCVLNKIAWELWALGELSSGRLSGSWSSPLGNSLNLWNESITKCTSVCNILAIASTVRGWAAQCWYIFVPDSNFHAYTCKNLQPALWLYLAAWSASIIQSVCLKTYSAVLSDHIIYNSKFLILPGLLYCKYIETSC